MKKRTPISKIMSTNVTTVNVTNSLKDVNNLIKENGFHHVPVVSGDEIIGILTKTDLQKISFVNGVSDDKVTTAMYDALDIEQVMTKEMKTVQKDDLIVDVATILANNEFHALPVLDGKELVGIVTTTDLIKFLIDQF